jgi:adenylosuccinate lyase
MDKEIEKYAPFVATTKILSALVKAGQERETMHAVIKDHAVATAKDMRYSDSGTPLYVRLANDERIPLDAAQIEAIVGSPLELVGMAPEQARSFARKIDELAKKYPDAVNYRGQDVL